VVQARILNLLAVMSGVEHWRSTRTCQTTGNDSCARKTITPTAEGYAERVEVDAGAGFFEYSALVMSRVICPKL